MTNLDLSCDLGEASTAAEQAIEDALWPLITSANVACGGHAGDDATMTHAVEQAIRFGVGLGAHPSYPDRENFGRTSLRIPPDELRASLAEQLMRLRSIARDHGRDLERAKPHGALYNDLHVDRLLAETVADAIESIDPTMAVVASASSQMSRVALERGLSVIREAFADRRYRRDGSLVSRREPNALLLDPDEAAEQASRLVFRREVMAEDGSIIEVGFDTLCIHGDMPGSVERLTRIRERLQGSR